MPLRRPVRSLAAALAALTLTAVVAPHAVGAPSGGSDVTSRAEAARVDRVKVPDLGWFDCSPLFGGTAQCGVATLPLDYDQPRGATTDVAVLRVPATDPARRIGTLFLNPGGPGGSGVEIAAAAPQFLDPEILARFDVVGVDPRGTNYSSNVQCFKDVGQQAAALSGMNVPFPVDYAETSAYVASSEAFGKACSTTGKPLSGSMSTAEVARDMDVLRRTFGDRQLTYLGFSYGSYLGSVYANLFPDRVRSLVIDGVLDPVAWAGTKATASVPQTERLRSGEGAWKALQEVLVRCGEAGPERCTFASFGDPVATYERVVDELKQTPVDLVDPETGELLITITYPILTSFLLGDLYGPDGYTWVDSDLTLVATLLDTAGDPARAADHAAAQAGLVERFRSTSAAEQAAAAQAQQRRQELGFGFPYPNGADAFQSVLCTDGLNPAKASSWPKAAQRADGNAPGFGPPWTWASAPCASSTWTVRDEDAYTGPFSRSSAHPVLVVGNYWDPATNYDGAVAADAVLGSSRLLSSDSWGHTAYGTSACVTDAVDAYLLDGTLPAEGTVCTGDVQPFADPAPQDRRAAPQRSLPPVVPPLPGALPRQ
ncbi:alpha/beta hydrolase [Cellulomonas fimi]|uniref:TAP domain protein n=1 Tax=Cellulomonas fimi (strain ATCC 484 / DSM 20113 / JCM 1341 / CCUG 24087 / LMG 16345 / NBRC 15513 / NCIMB 8980 / NCTC 7547 / NRS-133) TaxID=590998 RepID=F4H6C8_CELFA|nr:alpha/beta hydrolase [Cellulomonas fimi]AEE44440.1 TAP domain protein [Cellulomonas fimi ATCC 484]NNH06660.1 alpha/beta fold hydrolase [Cellulomonas fimi]VEH26367.1 Tripeptidyl aminopeptidase precursor [Cellulomonas fimi]